MTLQAAIDQMFKMDLETVLHRIKTEIENFKGTEHEEVIKARLLSNLREQIFILKDAREHKDDPRYQRC